MDKSDPSVQPNQAWQNAFNALAQMTPKNNNFVSGFNNVTPNFNFGFRPMSYPPFPNYYGFIPQAMPPPPSPIPSYRGPSISHSPVPPSIPPPPPPPLPAENPPSPKVAKQAPSTKPTIKFSLPKKPQSIIQSPASVRPSEIPGKESWPDPIKKYVQRAFAKCTTDLERDQVQIILRGKLTRAQQDSSLMIKDWENEPLPCLTFGNKTNAPSMHTSNNTSSPQNKFLPNFSPPLNFSNHLISKPVSVGKSPSKFSSKLGSIISRSQKRGKKRRSSSGSSSSSDNSEENIPIAVPFKKTKPNKLKRPPVSKEKLEKRAARFQNESNSNKTVTPIVINKSSDEFEIENSQVIGVCQEVEKPYYRLTSTPHAATIRPPAILAIALSKIKQHWLSNQDYLYACDQLKSIRQDLTVQDIRDEFTIMVYETHARISLEKGDHHEFNQCQNQLAMLNAEIGMANYLEFTGYRILYYIFTKNTADLRNLMRKLSPGDKLDPVVAYAFKVRESWNQGNFHRFFRLFQAAPKMSGFLMDWIVERERKKAIQYMMRAYRPVLPVSFVQKELAFASESECQDFLTSIGVVLTENATQINCKQPLVLS